MIYHDIVSQQPTNNNITITVHRSHNNKYPGIFSLYLLLTYYSIYGEYKSYTDTAYRSESNTHISSTLIRIFILPIPLR